MKKEKCNFYGVKDHEGYTFCIKRYMLRYLVYDEYFGNGIMIKSIIMKVDMIKDLCY